MHSPDPLLTRIERLEREVRWWRFIGTAVVAAFAVLLIGGTGRAQDVQTGTTVRAPFRVTNPEGKTLLSVNDGDNGPNLILSNHRGDATVAMVGGDDVTDLLLYGGGVRGIRLEAAADGGGLILSGPVAPTVGRLGSLVVPHITQASLVSSPEGGMLTLWDVKGKRREALPKSRR